MKRRYTTLLALVGLALGLRGAASTAPARKVELQAMVKQLAADDPAARDEACEQLVNAGPAARSLVMAALAAEDPEVKARAFRILLRRAAKAGDALPAARIQLVNYENLDPDARIGIIEQIATLEEPGKWDVLLQLLREDPSDDVGWRLVRYLRMRGGRKFHGELRAMEPAVEHAPMLVLMGRAWYTRDPERASGLFRRAIEREAQQPSDDQKELNVAYEKLIRDGLESKRYDDAADWLRRQASRSPADEPRLPSAVFDLFALHATVGPLRGFASDQVLYESWLGDPAIVIAIGKLYERAGQGVVASACFAAAHAATVTENSHRYQTAVLLSSRGWIDLAEREFETVLRVSDATRSVDQVNARIWLAALCVQRNDELAAAQHLDTAMQQIPFSEGTTVHETDSSGYERDLTVRDFAAQVHWRYLRAAQSRHDKDETARRLDLLVDLAPTEPSIVLDVVPALKEINRDADAKKLFEPAYALQAADLADDPASPELLNNLAWFCARSGERLDEALKMATAAIQAAPDSAAYLDTAAEAHFRLGHVEQAIQLETRAIQLRPDDTFMKEQLARFGKK